MSAEHRGCYWCRFRPLSKYLFEPIRYRFPNLGADMRKILLAIAAAAALFSSAQAAEKTLEEACQAQASASITRKWPKVLKGQFEIILKGNRCLAFLQAPGVIEGKRTAWLVDGTNGELLAEFTAPTTGAGWKDSDRGFCSYRGGKFKTGECTWGEYLDQADQT